MQPKIVEIVVYLLKELYNGGDLADDYPELTASLLTLGYTHKDISSAFRWVIHMLDDHECLPLLKDKRGVGSGIRMLSPEERMRIDVAGWGSLVTYCQKEGHSTDQIEAVLFRAMQQGEGRVGANAMQTMVTEVLFDRALEAADPRKVYVEMHGTSDDAPIH